MNATHDDGAPLHRYAQDKSEEAFAAVVRRHLDLVVLRRRNFAPRFRYICQSSDTDYSPFQNLCDGPVDAALQRLKGVRNIDVAAKLTGPQSLGNLSGCMGDLQITIRVYCDFFKA